MTADPTPDEVTAFNERSARYGRPDFHIEWDTTVRGFGIGEFRDLYGQPCSIQVSSSAEHDAIWLGVDDERMHLTLKQVAGLLDILHRWVDFGDFEVRTP